MALQAAPSGPQTGAANTAEDRSKEEAILSKANGVRDLWKTLATAFSLPHELPPRNKTHWDYLLQEGVWLSHDFMQERLWRQAVAFKLAHSAAAFNRKQLKSTTTKVTNSVELAPEGFGKVKPDKGGDASEQNHANGPASLLSGVSVGSMQLPAQLVSGPIAFLCTKELQPQVVAQLEDEDVARLAKHADVQARYQAQCAQARRENPPQLSQDEELLLLGQRRAQRRELTSEELANSPHLRAAQLGRIRAGAPAAMAGNLELDGTGNKGAARKRKGRDYVDEEYEPGMQKQRMANRAGAGMAGMQPGMPGVMGPAGMMGPGGVKGPNALNRAPSGLKSPMGKGGVPRVDSGMMRGGPGRMYSRAAWSPLDDQVLVAFVTEFGQNWYLVADVLRTANSIAGVSRRWDACRARYVQLLRSSLQLSDQDQLTQEQLQQPMMQKPMAKELMANALPVSEGMLREHRSVQAEVVTKLQQRRTQERNQSRELHKYRNPDHQSHLAIQSKMLQATNGRVLNPLEIGVVVELPPPPPQQLQPQQPAGGGGGGAGGGQHMQGGPPPGAAGLAGGRAGSLQPDGAAGQGAGQPASNGVVLPPGMTREQLIQMAQSNSLQALQANAIQAKQMQQAHPSPQNQQALQTAIAVFQMRQRLEARQQQQQQQQQQLMASQGLPPGPGMGPLGGGMGAMPPPPAPGMGLPGLPQPQGGMGQPPVPDNIITVAQAQQLIASNRIPAALHKQMLQYATEGKLTRQAVERVLQNQAVQQQMQMPQQPALPPLPQMPPMPGAGPPGAWPDPAAKANQAANQANQAANQAASQALAGAAGGLPGLPPFPPMPGPHDPQNPMGWPR